MGAKSEFTQQAILDIILANGYRCSDIDSYEGYFYLNESGEPVFVIEEKT